MKNLIILLTIPIYFSFNFLKLKGLGEDRQNEPNLALNKNSQIVYLFFKVEKNNSGSEKITLQEKKITDGKLKSIPISDENKGQNGDFIVSLASTNGKEIIKEIVEDPLNPSREVYNREEISRAKISLQNAEFSVRYSHSAEIQMVKIEKISETGKQVIFTQKL
ncbi:hypothetical protein [Chryseobacterium sp. MMS23-Vi53]|uniref:hypothetical protein n=1 Tax=Chryseobacterium sp. MMS23-Vi53 TaxID=3386644 RepID=UPI0039EC0047